MIPGVGNTPLTPLTPSTLSLPQGESDLFSAQLGQLPHLLARSLDLQRLKISRIIGFIRLVKALAKLGDPAKGSPELLPRSGSLLDSTGCGKAVWSKNQPCQGKAETLGSGRSFLVTD